MALEPQGTLCRYHKENHIARQMAQKGNPKDLGPQSAPCMCKKGYHIAQLVQIQKGNLVPLGSQGGISKGLKKKFINILQNQGYRVFYVIVTMGSKHPNKHHKVSPTVEGSWVAILGCFMESLNTSYSLRAIGVLCRCSLAKRHFMAL